jgi:hypothetical protein
VFCDMGTPSQCKKTLHCAPIELYLMDDLRFHEHKFDYGDGDRMATNIATLNVPSTADYVSPGFSVLRRTSLIISNNLASVWIDLAAIIIFTLKHGESSALCNGVGGGKRIDCGCAGQAYTLGQDNISWAPATSVGFGVFDEHIQSQKERDIFLASLGCIQDGIQDCLDNVQCHLGLPLLFNCEPRVETYASKIRDKFFASRFCNEWLTIQVKCLTRRDKTLTHLDGFICTWNGYSSTGAVNSCRRTLRALTRKPANQPFPVRTTHRQNTSNLKHSTFGRHGQCSLSY